MDDPGNPRRKTYTPQQAKAKAEHYCAYQERSQQEVRDKLYAWGLHREDVEAILSDLITENFLNEERFAVAYATGKLRMKGWGRYRIKQGLKQKSVSPPLIKIALAQLDTDEYEAKLVAVLQAKARTISETDPYKRDYKLMQYAFSRGFERDLIAEIIETKPGFDDFYSYHK